MDLHWAPTGIRIQTFHNVNPDPDSVYNGERKKCVKIQKNEVACWELHLCINNALNRKCWTNFILILKLNYQVVVCLLNSCCYRFRAKLAAVCDEYCLTAKAHSGYNAKTTLRGAKFKLQISQSATFVARWQLNDSNSCLYSTSEVVLSSLVLNEAKT